MIKLIAASKPEPGLDLQIFVEYKDNIWLLTKPYDLDVLTSAFVPGSSVEECIVLLNRDIDEPCFATVSPDNIRFVDDSLKSKIISTMIRNKRTIDAKLEN